MGGMGQCPCPGADRGHAFEQFVGACAQQGIGRAEDADADEQGRQGQVGGGKGDGSVVGEQDRGEQEGEEGLAEDRGRQAAALLARSSTIAEEVEDEPGFHECSNRAHVDLPPAGSIAEPWRWMFPESVFL